MVFAPHQDFTARFYGVDERWTIASAPFLLFQQLVTGAIPAWLWQKTVLFLTFFLCGLGAHRLFPFRSPGNYFAGLLYMVNPFTYVRFLAGQLGVLWAYALTPFAIKAFLELLEERTWKSVIKVAVLSTLVGLLQMHGFFLLFLSFFILFLVKLVKERRHLPRLLQLGKSIGVTAGAFCVLNFYWLLPILTAKDTIVSRIGRADLLFFAPKPTSGFGVMFDTASMYGFWRGGYIYAKDLLPFWWVLFVFILFLATYGAVSRLGDRKQGWIVLSFGAIGAVGFLLAVGAASELTKPLFEWLWEHFFFLRGFRDSQKLVALICLSYAYLGGLGLNELGRELRQQRKRLARMGLVALVAVALLTPLAYSFTMFGFHGQLGVTDYPREWYELNEYLNRDEEDFSVLFLPWHMYMDYSWLPNKDKRLGNPAQQFFDKGVIQGDNIEVPGIYSQSTNPVSRYVEFLLKNRNAVNNFGELLAPLNVKYVILVHEADYKRYDFLHHQEDLRIELEKPGITLFKNEHPVARIYGVDSVVYVEGLEEYLELSQAQDVVEHLYIIGSGLGDNGSAEMEKLKFVEKSPVEYQIGETSHKYTIFTVPQNVSTEHWEYNGKKPMKNLGFMPAFISSPGGAEVIYTRFYQIYLPSYIISLMALAFVFCYYFYPAFTKTALFRKKKTSSKSKQSQ